MSVSLERLFTIEAWEHAEVPGSRAGQRDETDPPRQKRPGDTDTGPQATGPVSAQVPKAPGRASRGACHQMMPFMPMLKVRLGPAGQGV